MKLYPVSQLYEFMPEVGAASGRPNPLEVGGVLNEAEFVDMRISPQRSRGGILCDIKWCAGFEGSNTALIVVTGVGDVAWSNDAQSRRLPWHARYVSWEPRTATRGDSPRPRWLNPGDEAWAVDASRASELAADGTRSSLVNAEDNEVSEYILEIGRLSISGLSAALYIGHVDGLDGAPPDMTELSDAEIIAGYPQWSSPMEVRERYTYPDSFSRT